MASEILSARPIRPPPPPPPMSSIPAPPPPPPPISTIPSLNNGSSSVSSNDNRSQLLADIRKGATLKKAPIPAANENVMISLFFANIYHKKLIKFQRFFSRNSTGYRN